MTDGKKQPVLEGAEGLSHADVASGQMMMQWECNEGGAQATVRLRAASRWEADAVRDQIIRLLVGIVQPPVFLCSSWENVKAAVAPRRRRR